MAASVHKAPPGRQKSEREFCLFGGVFLRSVCRAVCRGGLFCEACRCLDCWLLRPVPRRVFPAAARAAVRALCRRWARVLHLCSRPACLAACFFCAWPACLVFFRFCEGFHACRLFARSVCCLCGFFLSIFALFCLTSSSQKSFPLSLMPRRAPHFLFGKKMGEKNREGLCPFEPHSSALRPISPFFSLLAGLTALRAANRRLTGKRLKSQGAELSFSSVSVRRGTPVPCG